ncbi:glyoxalase [Novosphingobium mangrovi (ex Huang et al. 2023)]|uniref:Glyoxalase n=1 Tax=Novosphingobium mangrovi (ex Huang et al. 2023) TaxID=2976432 RepID=A0ABT2I0X4_9SPHN|nr:glyoxalase [Novosphingobium mangrovi (ex Huang et al. 2023)]MCT2398308.1 glyoxalase [Novosphingobium mangrovi (ex Huang et al. 2023)]
MQFPLVHVSWAIADNADRPACDVFFQDVFGAEPVYEILVTPETEKMGLDREETLMMIGDTMVIPIAPAGRGAQEGAPTGDMLRRSAAPMRWLGLALKVRDLAEADAWFAARGFKRHYDPGMEAHYFLVPRGQAMGVRLEIVKQDMPNEPRTRPDWSIARWRDSHPLGIEGLQAVGVSAPSLAEARELFGGKLEWPEIGSRDTATDGWCGATCAAFAMGDTVLEALVGNGDAGGAAMSGKCPVSAHARDVKGIYHLVFKVKDAASAVSYLRGKGLTVIGNSADRFAIHPEQAHGRLIWFTETTPEGYPEVGSKLDALAAF